MKKNLEFRAFNDVPWYIKEAVGWPGAYSSLTTEQQNFVYSLCLEALSSSSTREDLKNLKKDLEEIIENL